MSEIKDPTNDEKPKFPEQEVQLNTETKKWYYIDKKDDITYEYDKSLRAWFPSWNEDLINTQQSIYDLEEDEELKEKEPAQKKIPKPVEKAVKANTSIYVSGLPKDVSNDEIKEAFEKYGLIMEDILTNEPKIKIYRDEEGNCKGDALITYFKEESVELACELLDESHLRPSVDSMIRVQKADFSIKVTGDSTEQPKRLKLDPRMVKKKLERMERKLEWKENENAKKSDRFNKIVILKNMFSVQELEEDPALLLDIKEDIRTECEKFGEVTNVILYDKSSEGACLVKFKDEFSAVACIDRMNGRFFAQKQILAELYDGVSKYERSATKESQETEQEIQARLEKYATWLENIEFNT